MEWWRKAVVSPVRRALVVLAARMRRRKKHDGRGVLVKLHDDIKTCAYEDVQVMWEMLQRTETAGKQLTAACEPPAPPSVDGGAPALVWLGSRRRLHGGGVMDLRQRRRLCVC